MMAMTISNSINVKPLRFMERCARHFEFLRFMRFPFLSEQPKNFLAHPRKSYNVWTRKGNEALGKQG